MKKGLIFVGALAGGVLVVALLARSAKARPVVAPKPVEPPPVPSVTPPRVLTSEGLPALMVEIAEASVGQTDGSGYLARLGLNPDLNWCAAALTCWLRDASEHMGQSAPIAGSALSKELMRQFQAAGRWIPRDLMSPSDITPGLVAVWQRGEPNSDFGHAGVVVNSLGHGTFETVDANSTGSAVARNLRKLEDERLLGFGYLGD